MKTRIVRSNKSETERQNAELFKIKFQTSGKCISFRKAWGIPDKGFNTQKEHGFWYKKYIESINTYYKSDKYKERNNELKKKRREFADDKITESDIFFFSQRLAFANPEYKYEYDLNRMVLNSGKPIYWKDFIEQCILFNNPTYGFPQKPLPQPELRWNREYQFYDLIIENIFPDTVTKDFDEIDFTNKLKELKKKIPGHSEYHSKYKKNFDFGMKIIEIDKEDYLSDIEKTQDLNGIIYNKKSNPLWIKGKRERDRLRQNRSRMKKYIEKGM